MHNPKIFEVQFNIISGDSTCTLHALIKPTDNPAKFHVLRVQSLNIREHASVINDFFILRTTHENTTTWAHAGSGISSVVVQSIGRAIEQHAIVDLN